MQCWAANTGLYTCSSKPLSSEAHPQAPIPIFHYNLGIGPPCLVLCNPCFFHSAVREAFPGWSLPSLEPFHGFRYTEHGTPALHVAWNSFMWSGPLPPRPMLRSTPLPFSFLVSGSLHTADSFPDSSVVPAFHPGALSIERAFHPHFLI